jgi:hypothetical protein
MQLEQLFLPVHLTSRYRFDTIESYKKEYMMNDQPTADLQTLVDYYRNKSSQLEFDFVQYQISATATINDLKAQLEGNAVPDTGAAKPAK